MGNIGMAGFGSPLVIGYTDFSVRKLKESWLCCPVHVAISKWIVDKHFCFSTFVDVVSTCLLVLSSEWLGTACMLFFGNSLNCEEGC